MKNVASAIASASSLAQCGTVPSGAFAWSQLPKLDVAGSVVATFGSLSHAA